MILLNSDDIYFHQNFKNKKAAIKAVGNLMLEKGFIEKPYIKSMIKRDKVASVAIGNGLAIPHGEVESFGYIKKPGMVFLKLDKPLKWDDEEVYFLVGLALDGHQQIDVLQSLALSFGDKTKAQELYQLDDAKAILKFFEQFEGND